MEVQVLKFLKDNIGRRYGLYSKDQIEEAATRARAIVGDCLAPSCFIEEVDMPKNTFFLSRNLASMYDRPYVPIVDMLKMLKINLKTVQDDLLKLKAADLNLILIGYGGYSINTLEFLYELCIETGITGLFKTLTIYEDDDLTFTNSFRIFRNLSTPMAVSNKMPKLNLIHQDVKYDEVLSSKIILHNTKLTKEDYESRLKGKRVVFLGAPDFETRQFLEEANFLFGGHSGDEVSLIKNPEVNGDITVETYGTINSTTLFMNLLSAATQLPKALLGDFPRNTEVFTFNFRNYAAKKKLPLDFLLDLKRVPMRTH